MKTKAARVVCSIVGFVMVALSSAQAVAATYTHNILLIHGRSNSSGERFGVFTYDQHKAWNGMSPVTTGKVYFVQWDAWNRKFDDPTCPGGECIIKNAIDILCDANKHQECWIICHSAGCAAFEDYLAKSDYARNSILIAHVMAAESAAGGSEIADNRILEWFGQPIDESLKTSYARGAYNHNNMQGVYVRGSGGTLNNTITACLFFPMQLGSNLNPDCNACPVGRYAVARQCSDSAVALHSTCGHNRVASFQNCNSRILPYDDKAGTYDFHGWWITDHECNGGFRDNCNWSGPFSPHGEAVHNNRFRTYRVDHSGGKELMIDEYSYAPFALCP